MATLTRQTGETGSVTYAAATAGAGGDDWLNSGSERLHIKNGSGSPITATAVAYGVCDQGVLHDRAITIPAGQDRLMPQLAPSRFNNPATGKAKVTYSDVTTVTVALL